MKEIIPSHQNSVLSKITNINMSNDSINNTIDKLQESPPIDKLQESPPVSSEPPQKNVKFPIKPRRFGSLSGTG